MAEITIEQLSKIELRIGTVREAEQVEGSEKLLKLQVDFGSETRQIVSGIAKAYDPEMIIGKQAVFVTNLPPRTIMGLESNGMILAADGVEGLTIVGPDMPAPPGSSLH